MSGFLHNEGHFKEERSLIRLCRLTLLIAAWLEGYLRRLFEERSPVLPCRLQVIHHKGEKWGPGWHWTRYVKILMEWTWIYLLEPRAWGGTVVCCFSRYEWVDKEILPSRAPAEKIDRSLWRWLRTSTEWRPELCLPWCDLGEGGLMMLRGHPGPVCQVAAWVSNIHLTLSHVH